MNKGKEPEIITTPEALNGLVRRLGNEPMVAVDLEADSLHHYQEKVCLIQISVPSESVIVDPLALADLSPMASVMSDRRIRKVFHGADYDIRSLYRDFGIEVHNLFDTMIACQFLGEKELGLAAVLFKRFGVELDKRYQKADWSRRPLAREMIEYAVRDTSLLLELYGQLKGELLDRGRLEWVEEESELLTGVRANPRDREPLFLRFKGAARLDQMRLAVLEELLRLRDEAARESDLPPFKVLGNETVRILAERVPGRLSDLEGVPGLSARLVRRLGDGILAAVARATSLPPDRLPVYPPSGRYVKDKNRGILLKKLKSWREGMALELGMEAGLLVNNSTLEAVADEVLGGRDGAKTSIPLKHWQDQVFGKELRKVASELALGA